MNLQPIKAKVGLFETPRTLGQFVFEASRKLDPKSLFLSFAVLSRTVDCSVDIYLFLSSSSFDWSTASVYSAVR